MKTLVLKILSIGKNNLFVTSHTGKICFGIILSGMGLMIFKKGFFVALEFIGFTSFAICLLFVIIAHKTDIYAHQQERIRSNYKQRIHQRMMLLLLLTILTAPLGILLLFHYPYAFLLF